MQDNLNPNRDLGKVLQAADINSKENPLEIIRYFLRNIRKRWPILIASFALIFSVVLFKQVVSKPKYTVTAELISVTGQNQSSEVLNHPLMKLGPELIMSDAVIDQAKSQLNLVKSDGVTPVPAADKAIYLRNNLKVYPKSSKLNVLELTFTDSSEEQAKECMKAIIDSYQEYSEKSMALWKENQLKILQDKLKYYDESEKEMILGSKLITQAEGMVRSLNSLKEKFNNENPEHQEQLSHLLQEQVLGYRIDQLGQNYNSGQNRSPKNWDKQTEAKTEPPEKIDPENSESGIEIVKIETADKTEDGNQIQSESGQSPVTKNSDEELLETIKKKEFKKNDYFEKELAQLQLFLFQSRILQQLRTTIAQIEQKARNRRILDSQLEIPIHVEVNKKPQTLPNYSRISRFRLLLVACVLSVGLGIASMFVMDQFDDRFRSPVEAEKNLVKPVMGVIPAINKNSDSNMFTYHRKEAFFVTKIFMEKHGIGQGILGITSGSVLEKCEETSYDLAKIYANYGVKTLLIDANFRNGKLSENLKSTFGIGLSDLLQQPEVSSEAIKRLVCNTEEDNLFFISQGTKSSTPLLLFDQKRLQSILSWAEENYDLVILDLPSSKEFNDAKVIGRYCDQMLFVISPELTTRQTTRRAIVSLESFGCHVAGMLFIDSGKSQVWDSTETSDSPLYNVNQTHFAQIKNQQEEQQEVPSENRTDSSETVRAA